MHERHIVPKIKLTQLLYIFCPRGKSLITYKQWSLYRPSRLIATVSLLKIQAVTEIKPKQPHVFVKSLFLW